MICQVNLFSGELISAAADFSLQGWLPIEFARVYKSNSSHRGVLGLGWMHTYDVALRRDADDFVYRNEFGVDTRFAAAQEYTAGDQTLIVSGDTAVIRDAVGTRRVFASRGAGIDLFNLVAVADAYGNALLLDYQQGRLVTLRDDLERVVKFHYGAAGYLELLSVAGGPVAEEIGLVRYEYDGSGNLVRVSDSAGVVASYDYSGGRLVCERDANGFPVYAEYDGEGRCIRLYYEDGRRLQAIAYDSRRRNTLVTNSLGFSRLYRFNEAGALIEEVDPLGARTQRIYDADNRLLTVLGPDGQPVVTSVHDVKTRTTTESNWLGSATITEYGPLNLPVSVTNAEGHTRHHEYDGGGRLTLLRSPLGREWHFFYDARGMLVRVVCPDGYTLYREYTADWSTVTIRDEWGVLERRTYDALGNIIEYQEGLRTERIEYDLRNRMVAHAVGTQPPTRYGYDGETNLVKLTTPLGHTMQFRYSPCGSLIEQVDPEGHRVRYELDSEEQLVAVINERGERTTITYDPLGRPVATTFFDGRREEIQYDALGNPVAVVDGAGRITRTAYDPGGLVTERILPDATEETYSYDPLGRLVTAEGPGYRLEYAYDPDDRLVREVQTSATIEYAYDTGGLLAAVRDSFGREVRFTYTPRRFLDRIADNGRTYEFTSDPSGRLITALTFPGGMRQELSYDDIERLIERRVFAPGGAEVARRRFEYDADDQLTGMEDGRLGRYSYEYDTRGKLVLVRRGRAPVERYTYDGAGNLTSTPQYPAITTDPGNRVVRAGERAFDYGSAGELESVRDGAAVTRFGYDGSGQLNQVDLPNGEVWRYAYDAFGRRVIKQQGETARRFCWDGNLLRAETASSNGGAQARTDYLFVPDTFVALSQHEGDVSYHYSFDQVGTPTEIWDSNGGLVFSLIAEAYGVRSPTTETVTTPFHFQGQYVDTETGLYHTRFRHYDPTLGRFTTQDPLGLGAGLNMYVYPPNPLNWIDPLGLRGPKLQLKCDPNWNACQQYAAKLKADNINKAAKKKQLKRTDPCRTNQRDYYERKCADPDNPGSTHDIDHMLELQLGGMDKCCSNLWEMPRGPNRSMGSQIKSQMNALKIKVDGCVGGVKITGCKKAKKCSPKPKPPSAGAGCEEAD